MKNLKSIQGGQELICMNVDKVYDWVLNQGDFSFSGTTSALSFNPAASVPTGDFTPASVTCEVTADATNPIVIVSREDRVFIIDGAEVTLQLVTIQKNANVVLTVTLQDGTILTSDPIPASRFEQVVLCAPEGTDISVEYTDIQCFVTSTGTLTGNAIGTVGTITFSDLGLSIIACQSIQSTYPVTVEFFAEFCEPRDILPTTCPAPVLPPQCPTLFPNLPVPPEV